MSRRRYISSAISDDKIVARIEKKYGDFAGLLYDRMIPHADDDATITGDPEDLLALVFPHRRDKTVEDIEAALTGIAEEGLIGWDREGAKIYFPIESFYKYQAYIGKDKRRNWEWAGSPETKSPNLAENNEADLPLAQIGGDQRELAENGAHARTPSVSVSSSVSHSVPSDEDALLKSACEGNEAVPPNIADVRSYFSENGMPNEASRFFTYYSSIGWVVGKSRTRMKSWRQAAAGWILRERRRDDGGNSRASPSTAPITPRFTGKQPPRGGLESLGL